MSSIEAALDPLQGRQGLENWGLEESAGGGTLVLRQEGFGRVQRGGPFQRALHPGLGWDFAGELESCALSESLAGPASVLRVSALPLPHTRSPPIDICTRMLGFLLSA